MLRPSGADATVERHCEDGSVNLSRNHLVLLLGLLDRPNATAIGRRDWVAAARPYVRRYRGAERADAALYHAIDWLPFRWVRRQRCGRFMSYRLLQRGRGILDGSVLARVSGRYAYAPGHCWWWGREGRDTHA